MKVQQPFQFMNALLIAILKLLSFNDLKFYRKASINFSCTIIAIIAFKYTESHSDLVAYQDQSEACSQISGVQINIVRTLDKLKCFINSFR